MQWIALPLFETQIHVPRWPTTCSSTHIRVPHILAVAIIWCLVRSKLPIVQPLFEGGDYSRVAIIQGSIESKEIRYAMLGDDVEMLTHLQTVCLVVQQQFLLV